MKSESRQDEPQYRIVTTAQGEEQERAVAAAIAAMNSDAFRKIIEDREKKEAAERRSRWIKTALCVLAAVGFIAFVAVYAVSKL